MGKRSKAIVILIKDKHGEYLCYCSKCQKPLSYSIFSDNGSLIAFSKDVNYCPFCGSQFVKRFIKRGINNV